MTHDTIFDNLPYHVKSFMVDLSPEEQQTIIDYIVDQSNVGTLRYRGIAPFWNGRYKHILREFTKEQLVRVHHEFLKRGLLIWDWSDWHQSIIDRVKTGEI